MDNKKIVEINGIKMEVDLRHAKTIDSYKIGDRVKILVKDYGDTYNTNYGVIVDFNEFQSLPTIVVAYIKESYSDVEVKIVSINSAVKGFEITPLHEIERGLLRQDIERIMDKKIEEKENDLSKAKEAKKYLIDAFSKYFEDAYSVLKSD